MQRSEGVQVIREICQCIPDALISSISIMPRSTEEFELRISMFFDRQSLQHIQAIVDSHGLILREDKGTLLIYRDEMEGSRNGTHRKGNSVTWEIAEKKKIAINGTNSLLA